MTEQKIVEGNSLIADFMGLYRSDGPGFSEQFTEKWYDKKTRIKTIDGPANYHKDWNRLIPVIEKISLIEIAREFDGDGCLIVWRHHPVTFGMLNQHTGKPMVRFYASGLFEADTLIQAAWEAVVDFIKWQNESK